MHTFKGKNDDFVRSDINMNMYLQDIYQVIFLYSLVCMLLSYIFRRFVLEIKNDFRDFFQARNRDNILFYSFIGAMLIGWASLQYTFGIVILLGGSFVGFLYFLCVNFDNLAWDLYTLYIIFSFGVFLTVSSFLFFIKYDIPLWEYGYLIIILVWSAYLKKIISMWRNNEFSISHIMAYLLLMIFMLFEIYFFLGVLLESDLYPNGRESKEIFYYIVASIGNTIYVSSGSPILGANTKMIIACIITQFTNVLITTLLLGFFVTVLSNFIKKHSVKEEK